MEKTTLTGKKFWIFFGKNDPIDLDTGMGRRRRETVVYYDTAKEARTAIRKLSKREQKHASIEESEFF